MKLFSLLFATIFVLSQTSALIQSTHAAADLATAEMAFHDPQSLLTMADRAETTLNQNSEVFAKEDQGEEQVEQGGSSTSGLGGSTTSGFGGSGTSGLASSLTPKEQRRIERKTARWTAKLNRRLPQAQKSFGAEIDKMDVATLEGKVANLKKSAHDAGREDLVQRLDQHYVDGKIASALKQDFAAQSAALVPQIAANIAQAGGIVPYVFHLKTQLHQQKDQLAKVIKSSSKADRQIASLNTLQAITLTLLCVMVVCILFGLIFAIGALAEVGVVAGFTALCIQPGVACWGFWVIR